MRNTNVIGATGHSDYGAVFEQFWEIVSDRELTPQSTVVIGRRCRAYQPARPHGCARQHRPPDPVGLLAQSRPRPEWSVFDSEMDAYAEQCTRALQVRDLEQLAHCVETIVWTRAARSRTSDRTMVRRWTLAG